MDLKKLEITTTAGTRMVFLEESGATRLIQANAGRSATYRHVRIDMKIRKVRRETKEF